MENIDYKKLFYKNYPEAFSNIIFYGAGIFVITFIKKSLDWDIFATILLIIFLALTLVEITRLLINLSSFFILYKKKYFDTYPNNKKFCFGIIAVQITENLIFLIYSFYLLSIFEVI